MKNFLEKIKSLINQWYVSSLETKFPSENSTSEVSSAQRAVNVGTWATKNPILANGDKADFSVAREAGLGNELSIADCKMQSSLSVDNPAPQLYQNKELAGNKLADLCSYCQSKNFVKRGLRKKKLENVQLYLCKDCGRTFTSQSVKGKKYPMRVVLDGISYHNLGFTLEDSCRLVSQKFGVDLKPSTLGSWNEEFSDLCRYSRLRPFAVKMCRPAETVEVTTMAHRQIYRFRYHRPKLKLIIEEQFKNSRFGPLKDYLDSVSAETPHQYFQEGIRISEIKTKFDKAQMIIRGKKNYANELASFVLQSVRDNKQRHEEIQRFMIANDSVTVATEVPVYIRKEDIEHMENQLGFVISQYHETKRQRPVAEIAESVEPQGTDFLLEIKGKKEKQFPRLLTGHVDILQVRNGQVHILDYKPNAAKEKPVEQLTWYALALSRLTGLRLYEFKCAWFDEKDYFEFYPLHVVYKLKDRKRGKIKFKSGIAVEIPTKNTLQIV